MVNKTELINAAAEAAQVTKKDAAAVVNAVLDTIAQTLADGDKVQLVGFGNFEIRERKARQGKNPRTGEAVTIAAFKVPSFKAGKALKDGVNN